MRENGDAMAHELLIGVGVVDGELYTRYREEMTPLLEAVGGRFRFDVEVSRVLLPAASSAVNRVFVLSFPDRATRERYFADPRYLKIRERLFVPSTNHLEIIAEYAH